MQGVWLHLESRGGAREAVDGTIHKDNMKRIKFRRFTLIEQVRRGSGEKRFRVKARILGFVWVTLADFKTHREAEAYIRSRADEVSGATISSYYQELPARMPYMDTYLLSYIVCESGRIKQSTLRSTAQAGRRCCTNGSLRSSRKRKGTFPCLLKQ